MYKWVTYSVGNLKSLWKWLVGVILLILIDLVKWMLEKGETPKGAGVAVGYFAHLWSYIPWLCYILIERIETPRWWFWFSALVTLFVIAYAIYRFYRFFFPSYRQYTEDTFGEILWRWKWTPLEKTSGQPGIMCLTPHCPVCKLELTRHDTSGGLGGHAYIYFCADCQEKFTFIKPDEVRKRIRRKVENGSGKNGGQPNCKSNT
jgi:hypothetical protein